MKTKFLLTAASGLHVEPQSVVICRCQISCALQCFHCFLVYFTQILYCYYYYHHYNYYYFSSEIMA